jgi:peptidoglycan DL-endopeptidase LytF
MTRRDTIIVAALVNAGLLIILFVSALKEEAAQEEIVIQKEAASPAIEPPFRSEAKKVMGDEVDLVLKQYSQQDPLQPAVENTTSLNAHSSFVEDLKASTTPETPSIFSGSQAEASNGPSYMEIKVKKGDVLEKIARQNHTSVSEIMKINHLASTQLKIGQVLKVPVKAAPKEEEKPVVKTPLDSSSARYYTVKPGDNPWTIAVKNHIRVEDLLKLNNLTEEKARKLKPGDQIRIH